MAQKDVRRRALAGIRGSDARTSPQPGAIFEDAFPQRGAVDALQRRVVTYIRAERLSPGTPFMTDADLASRSGLSRSTIRRALEPLQREGWLSREAGRGTFVGPRAASGLERSEQSNKAQRSIRLGVLLFDIGKLSEDWITPLVMAGIDRAADTHGLSVELLGMREVDADSFSRRLERSRPDVLASLAAQPRDAMMLREAVRLDLQTLVVGTAHQFLGLPTVAEDNCQGMNLALDFLREAGHDRIGLVVNRWPGAWVFQRQEAFERRLAADGLDLDAAGTCWIGSSDHPAVARDLDTWSVESDLGRPPTGDQPVDVDRVAAWLERSRPTAVVAGSYSGLHAIGTAAKRLGWSIPEDLSVVAMDEHPHSYSWLGVELTAAALPLGAMGEQVARTARALADGAKIDEAVLVPFTPRPGASVAAPRSNR
ncbi:MAG: LacI family DNA-binding transcriptional regulator [Planctomycetota bacterium]